MIDLTPYRVKIAGVYHYTRDLEHSREVALREIEAWKSLGYRARKAEIIYRDGTLVETLGGES